MLRTEDFKNAYAYAAILCKSIVRLQIIFKSGSKIVLSTKIPPSNISQKSLGLPNLKKFINF